MIGRVISKAQSAFVKGRYILDSTVIVHEIMHEMRKKQRGVIMKIDFEKAYDRIRWEFVQEVLQRKGFDHRFTEWVMKTVKGGRVYKFEWK